MYERRVSRQNPGVVSLVLDDSGSQGDRLPGTSDPKWMWVERYAGHILKELLERSTEVKGDSVVIKPRYYVHTILYGRSPHVWGNGVMSIEEAVEKYAADGNSLGLGGKLSGTDTEAALCMAEEFLKQAVTDARFRDSFPPMLFHLSDGMSESDASDVASRIRNLATSDGNVLVVNAFIGATTSLRYSSPEDFPGYVTASEAGSDDNVRMFNMSSEIPECIRQNLIADGIFPKLRAGARAFFDVRTKEMLKHVIQVVGSIGSRAERQER